MKKFINNPEHITAELLEGYTLAYADKVSLVSEKIVVRTHPKSSDKVAIVTLGGAGHEPALSGFVGEGMLDASVVGDIFAAPGAPKLLEALKLFNRDAGILLVVLNHAGDVMSANMALQLAEREGINVKMLLTHEDISAGLDTPAEDRRGLAGCVPLFKVAGAAAEAGKSLDEVYEIAERFNQQMATLAVAMTGATHPQNGQSISELPDDEMEIGMGQHGEAGGGRTKILTADETAERMLLPLVQDDRCQIRRQSPADHQRRGGHHGHGDVPDFPQSLSVVGSTRNRGRLGLRRRVVDRAGDGRFPDDTLQARRRSHRFTPRTL